MVRLRVLAVARAQPARCRVAGNQDPEPRVLPVVPVGSAVPVVKVALVVPVAQAVLVVQNLQARRARLVMLDDPDPVAVAERAGNQDPDLRGRN